MLRITRLAATFFLALVLVAGCGAHTTTRTVKKETVHYSAEKNHEATEPVVIENQTAETTTSRGNTTGVLSGAVHATGHVLALPFRFVGGLIELMF